MKRDLIPLGLALVLVPATVATVLALMSSPAPSVIAFPTPAHRLAVAVDAAMTADLASVKRDQAQIRTSAVMPLPAGPAATTGSSLPPPDDSFGFLLPAENPATATRLRLSSLVSLRITGTTRDGREVVATIKPDPFGDGGVVDFGRDAAIAEALAPKITEALANPAHPPGSPEDRADLAALFRSAFPANLPPAVPIPPAPPLLSIDGSVPR